MGFDSANKMFGKMSLLDLNQVWFAKWHRMARNQNMFCRTINLWEFLNCLGCVFWELGNMIEYAFRIL